LDLHNTGITASMAPALPHHLYLANEFLCDWVMDNKPDHRLADIAIAPRAGKAQSVRRAPV